MLRSTADVVADRVAAIPVPEPPAPAVRLCDDWMPGLDHIDCGATFECTLPYGHAGDHEHRLTWPNRSRGYAHG